MEAPKKGVAAMLVEKLSPGPKQTADGDSPEANDDTYEGKMACADDMMSAIQEGNAESFLKALDAYLAHR